MRQKILIVPVYNEEKMVLNTLNEVFPSVNAIVIINDGSTDSSEKKITEWI
ncbi:glycosyltransferase, partial [bacterium]|nr:glycosyltransferase [bacterium]